MANTASDTDPPANVLNRADLTRRLAAKLKHDGAVIAGIGNNEWVRDAQHFEALIDRRFDDGGPVLLAAKINDKPGTCQTPRDPALIRNRFMKGLGTGRGGALDA